MRGKDICVFCKIVRREAPARIVFEDDDVIAFESIAPVSSVHLLIVPKWHIPTFSHLEEQHKNILIKMAIAAQKLIEEKKISKGYRLVFNGGKYQSIKHIHWHLMGGEFKDEGWLEKT